MKVDVWSALPPDRSGIADYVAEALGELSRHVEVACRVEDPLGVDPAIRRAVTLRASSLPSASDLGLFHLGNSPSQGFVWQAARRSEGVLVLHEWCLGHVVRHETLGKGDARGWRREARLGRRASGSLFARLVEQGWGGSLLPLFFPMNEALIHKARGVVALSRATAERARALSPRVPVLALPLHFVPPAAVPDRDQARRALGLPLGRFLMTSPGLATHAKRIDVEVRVLARLVAERIDAGLVVAGDDPLETPVMELARAAGVGSRVHVLGRLSREDFAASLASADVVLGLRFPSHGETSAAAIRALGLGACVVLTAGSETALELPRGTCVCVTPGGSEEEELVAVLRSLSRRNDWCVAIGAAAADHVARHHDVEGTVGTLAGFLEDVSRTPPRSSGTSRQPRSSCSVGRREEGLAAELLEEAELAALEIGLDPLSVSVDALIYSLVGGPS